jgi:hypothetical protein
MPEGNSALSSSLKARKPLALLKLVAMWMVLLIIVMYGWLALTFLMNRDPSHPVSSAVVFNYLLVTLLAVVGLPLWHRALYRWFWHVEKKERSGEIRTGGSAPAFGTELTEPVPTAGKTPRQRVLYASLYAVGSVSLLVMYGPLQHVMVVQGFLARLAVDSASYRSLVEFVTCLIPMGGLLIPLMFMLRKERAAIDAGELDAREALRLRLKHDWLFSFVTAFVVIGFLCFFLGETVAKYLA